jgi:hypothetical protein
VRVTGHEVNAPFRKWSNGNYHTERRRMISNIIIIGLTSVTFMNCENAILEKRWPEVTIS